MVPKCHTISNQFQKVLTITRHYHTPLHSSAHTPSWASTNKLFQKHPKLQHLQHSQCNSLTQLCQILSYIFVSGLHRNPFVMSRVLYRSLIEFDEKTMDSNMKTMFGNLLFSQIPKPNLFSWNTMIRFFAMSYDVSNASCAFHYYVQMLRSGVFPDKYTFPFLLQTFGFVYDVGLVKQVHCHVIVLGFDVDLYVGNSVLRSYLVCGSLYDALQLFDEMTVRDVVSWTTLISGLGVLGSYSDALYVFSRMAVDELDVRPNVATMVTVLSTCGNLGSLGYTTCLHTLLTKEGWLEMDVSIGNSLIDAYSKCGKLEQAMEVFSEMRDLTRDLCSWTTMISGLAVHGRGRDAMTLLTQMKVLGVIPDSVTFIAALSACAHSGLVEEGIKIFESMKKDNGIMPELKHYGCMIDLLGRAGMVERAYSFVESIPMEPNLAILGSLLSACRIHNNVEVAEFVLNKIELLSERGGARVLLSNIYANDNQWSKVLDIRRQWREEKLQEKPPGRSWIEVKEIVHVFVVGDKSHPGAGDLYALLDGLLKALVYHPSTDYDL